MEERRVIDGINTTTSAGIGLTRERHRVFAKGLSAQILLKKT